MLDRVTKEGRTLLVKSLMGPLRIKLANCESDIDQGNYEVEFPPFDVQVYSDALFRSLTECELDPDLAREVEELLNKVCALSEKLVRLRFQSLRFLQMVQDRGWRL